MSDFNYMSSIVEKIVVERNQKVDSAVLGEIQQIAVENGLETKIVLNEKNVADALRKQIPQKVNISLKGTTDWTTRCRCPSCGNYIFDSQKYCAECGQRIDWGDKK